MTVSIHKQTNKQENKFMFKTGFELVCVLL